MLRIGCGFDVHAFTPDSAARPLVLGGTTIPNHPGLAGHSDADVLTHAIIDALLGALALGDIGRLFPDTDVRYRNINSQQLLATVVARLQQHAATVVNVDATIAAQTPPLAPHIPAMQTQLAATLQIDAGRVSVKATTTERLGFVGRREGMAASAVTLLAVQEQ